jgi:hypothetical protein
LYFQLSFLKFLSKIDLLTTQTNTQAHNGYCVFFKV